MSEEDYKNAYLTISQELGEFRGSSHLMRMAYDATASELRAARRSSRVPSPQLRGERHFLVLANGRTGGTWLTTTLDQMPDVRCRKEMRWRSPQTGYHEVQVYIDQSTTSVAAAIEKTSYESGAKIFGSKFLLDPYWYVGPEIAEDMASILEPSIRLILLKRRYVETWISWKVRGVYYRLRKDVMASGVRFDAELTDSIGTLSEPKPVSLGLCVGGKFLPGASEGASAYSLATAVDDMLVLFANDIAFLKLMTASKHGKVVDYGELSTEFQSLAEFLGTPSPGTQKALTEKLDDVSGLVTPRFPLEEFADALDAGFWQVARGAKDPDAMWSIQPDNTAQIAAPGFWDLVKKYGLRAEEVWPLLKPVARV